MRIASKTEDTGMFANNESNTKSIMIIPSVMADFICRLGWAMGSEGAWICRDSSFWICLSGCFWERLTFGLNLSHADCPVSVSDPLPVC